MFFPKILIKVIPTILISVLNVLMLIKLREIRLQRRKLKASINSIDLKSFSCSKLSPESGFSEPSTTSRRGTSITTISRLLFRPEIPGQDPAVSAANLSRLRRSV